MAENFYSIFADHIKKFISMKRKLGYKFTNIDGLVKIDQHALNLNEKSQGITIEFANGFCKKRESESLRNQYYRVSMLAIFSSYLRDNNIDSYIPKLPKPPANNFVPYIFSHSEIIRIFKAADEIKLHYRNSKDTSIMCIPSILRLLYSTGLRVSEAINIKISDLALADSYLKVTDCKTGKERLIPISSSLTKVLSQYLHHRNKIFSPSVDSEYLFIKLNGKTITAFAVRRWLRIILDIEGIVGNSGSIPRVHDLRHTFAVSSLANMAEAGLDLYATLPILSCYLGHSSIKSTDHYVRLTSSMYPKLIDNLDNSLIDVFPNLRNYETD